MWLPRPAFASRGLLDDLRREPLEDRSRLGARCVGRRLQLVMVVAVQQLGGNRPLQVARGPCADGGGIREGAQVCFGAGVELLEACIAAHHGSHLLAGDLALRAERRIARAVDHAVGAGPSDRVGVVRAFGDIREACAAGASGLPSMR